MKNKIAACTALLVLLNACTDKPAPAKQQPLTPKIDAKACASDKTMLEKYAEHTAKGDHWKAARSISNCADASQDADLLAMVKESETKVWVADFGNKKLSAAARLDAHEKLKALNPDEASKLEKDLKGLTHTATADEKASKEMMKHSLRHSGASIGMTEYEATQTGWGHPVRRYKTTTAYGVREQWDYGNGKYLFFDNGILSSIHE